MTQCRVVAVDSSAAQLTQAVQKPNIDYSCGPAEKVGLPDNCADLVTVATAFHWYAPCNMFPLCQVMHSGPILKHSKQNGTLLQEELFGIQLSFCTHIVARMWQCQEQL